MENVWTEAGSHGRYGNGREKTDLVNEILTMVIT